MTTNNITTTMETPTIMATIVTMTKKNVSKCATQNEKMRRHC
jgi:hypothetical protein